MNSLTTTEQAERLEIDSTLAETKVATTRHIDALWRCREKELWRSTHQSFKDYCAEHSFLKESAIYRALKAEEIRKSLAIASPDCSTATVVTDRTALALEKVKPNHRKKVLKRAVKAAGNKPVSPKHIAQAKEGLPGYSDPKPLTYNPYQSHSPAPSKTDPSTPIKPPTVATTDTSKPSPIPLNPAQIQAIQQWAADDRLWSTQETVAHNLQTFARLILSLNLK